MDMSYKTPAAEEVGHDLQGLQKQITALSDALARLSTANDLRELLLIIKRPGWTTPAEFTLVSGLIASMNAQVQALAQTQSSLLQGARTVGR